jgi:hypothetical protein
MSRLPACLVGLLGLVVLVLLGGCSARAEPTAPGDGSASRSSATAEPYHLDRLDALRAVRAVDPRGFTRVLSCRSRHSRDCRRDGTQDSRWFVGTLLQGAPLPDANGMGEFVRTVVTAWPSPAAASAYSGRLTHELDRYDGDYDIVLKRTGPRRYVPGDRGRGELHPVTFAGWRGTVLRRLFHYVFDGLTPSATVTGGRAVLARGRYVLDLEWVARTQETDRRLSQLPRRLLRALG